MPRAGSPYGHHHVRARAALLADNPPCAYCGDVATVADHQPPVSMHEHLEGSGCCVYVPSCGRCSSMQGGMLAGGRSGVRGVVTFDDAEPVPPPDDDLWDVAWMAEVREVPDNATWPRFMTAPHPAAVGTHFADFEEWYTSRNPDQPLRWWQRLAGIRILEHDVGGELVWRKWFVSVARQLGKSHFIRELLVWALTDVDGLWGTASTSMLISRKVGTAESVLLPILRWARDIEDPDWKPAFATGRMKLTWREERDLLIRSIELAYGETVALGVVDECWDVKESDVSEGLDPTILESGGRLGFTSTAHR